MTMATYRILYWQEVPSQIRAEDENGDVSLPLPQKFMKVVYDETPEQMVAGVTPILDAGARILGACCGSTPEHIRAFRAAMDAYERNSKLM